MARRDFQAVLAEVLEQFGDDPSALRRLTEELDDRLRAADLDRFLRLWNVSRAEAGRMFGVSRQAVSQWLTSPPADRAPEIAALGRATSTLARHVKRERIPAVVRRRAPALGDRSLLEMAGEGRFDEVAEAVDDMFDLRRLQP